MSESEPVTELNPCPIQPMPDVPAVVAPDWRPRLPDFARAA
jgi:hypothetical protein